MKKKIVILTGAGFTKLWDAPSTKDITDSILKINDPLSNLVSELLKQQKQEPITFEHIIDEIETIFQYYYTKAEWENRIYGHDNDEQSAPDNIWVAPLNVEIVKLLTGAYPKRDVFSPSDTIQMNIRGIHRNIIDNIIKQVISYIGKPEFEESKKGMNAFINYFKDDYILRFYTLNYDRYINTLGNESFYDGFDQILDDNYFLSNPVKILENLEENCAYNLHGSVYYSNALSNRPWVFDWVKGNEPVDDPSGEDKQNQAGGQLLMSSIITGFHKSERLLFKPISCLFNAFQRDCAKADIIITIGYSFSDIHINQSIQTALDFGKCRFVSVDLIKNWNAGSIDFNNEHWTSLTDPVRSVGGRGYSINADRYNERGGMITNEKRYFYWKGIEDFVRDKEAWELIKK